MTRFLLLAVLGLACALPGSPARAVGPSVFFVSANGSDSNGCTASAPCLTVNHVLTLSPPAGSEIDCIIPGNIVAVAITLTNSITINCLGGVAAAPITVNTSGTVTLRGIHVQGFGSIGNGILFQAGTLTLDNVVVEGFGDGGLSIESGGNVTVTNSKFTNCNIGIFISPSSTPVFVSLSHVTAEKNDNSGIFITDAEGGKSEVNLVDSVVTSNAQSGVQVSGAGAGNPLQFLTVQRSSVVMNGGDGLVASGANTFVLIGESSLAWNANNGIESQSNGLVFSYRNNQVNGNAMNDLAGTVNTSGLQ